MRLAKKIVWDLVQPHILLSAEKAQNKTTLCNAQSVRQTEKNNNKNEVKNMNS